MYSRCFVDDVDAVRSWRVLLRPWRTTALMRIGVRPLWDSAAKCANGSTAVV